MARGAGGDRHHPEASRGAYVGQGDRAGERGRWSWIINKLKDLGSGAWNKLKDAARAGYDAFKKAYERYVPWLVRKAIEVGATVYEVYSVVRDFIGL